MFLSDLYLFDLPREAQGVQRGIQISWYFQMIESAGSMCCAEIYMFGGDHEASDSCI